MDKADAFNIVLIFLSLLGLVLVFRWSWVERRKPFKRAGRRSKPRSADARGDRVERIERDARELLREMQGGDDDLEPGEWRVPRSPDGNGPEAV